MKELNALYVEISTEAQIYASNRIQELWEFEINLSGANKNSTVTPLEKLMEDNKTLKSIFECKQKELICERIEKLEVALKKINSNKGVH